MKIATFNIDDVNKRIHAETALRSTSPLALKALIRRVSGAAL
jgi:hypothetical protein